MPNPKELLVDFEPEFYSFDNICMDAGSGCGGLLFYGKTRVGVPF